MYPDPQIKFDAPAFYRIIVNGVLSDTSYPFFEGMNIKVLKDEDKFESTIITGYVKDQAALAGLLNMLYDLHYPILKIEYTGDKYLQRDKAK